MPLSDEELAELLQDLESDRVERTESVGDTDKFCQAICAFSNDFPRNQRPGYLLIGVDNRGRPLRASVTDRLLTELGGLRSSGKIQPLPMMTVQKRALEGGHEIAVIEVLPSDMPPVRYEGRVWIRVGPRKAVASEAEERVLVERRASHDARTFDARACAGSSLKDLSLGLFKNDYLPNAVSEEVLEENHREVREQLASLRFYDLPRQCPTNAGILLFGLEAQRWIEGARVQFIRFDGPEMSDDVRNDRSISGDLLTLLRDLDRLIEQEIDSHPVATSALREAPWRSYPRVAVRELVMNAIMHRDYEASGPIRFYWFSDRVEIQSPGSLYGESTPENFPTQNAYRNPVLAEAMKVLGYVNRFGRGVARAQDALDKNGSPRAEFKFDAHYVLATVRRRG
ncbi:MAG: putative DNA binding domain-containing protein [Deltaproteobacteria bacterium]|nr:putative DNA binding domain-containing protein [Deltaproteobacteria bacterium]